jgi:hypothetical protein
MWWEGQISGPESGTDSVAESADTYSSSGPCVAWSWDALGVPFWGCCSFQRAVVFESHRPTRVVIAIQQNHLHVLCVLGYGAMIGM